MAGSQAKSKSKSAKLRAVPSLKKGKGIVGLQSISSKMASLPVNAIKVSKLKVRVKPTLKGIVASLSIVFFVVWILIGLFVGLLMVQGLRRGVFDNLLFAPNAVDESQTQTQTEANLPGVGVVNVDCVRNALSQASIQKLVESRDMNVLTSDEKTKLEPCITQKEEATPSSSPNK